MKGWNNPLERSDREEVTVPNVNKCPRCVREVHRRPIQYVGNTEKCLNLGKLVSPSLRLQTLLLRVILEHNLYSL